MIYTLTLNPSLDYIVGLEQIKVGKLNRTENEAKFPGGKGINVSRVLRKMGVESTAMGFLGGFTGRYIQERLAVEGIITSFINVAGDTRINIKIKTDTETEINGQGPHITSEDLLKLKEKIRQSKKGDYLVLAGSIPAKMPETTYDELVKICNETGTDFIVDAEGDLLKRVLEYKPFLIKPNHHELGQFFDTTISTAEEAVVYGKKLVALGAKNVIVSLAGEGAVFVNSEESYIASVPKGEVKSSVGAGDSMVAGFLARFLKLQDYREAFKFSVASGSATAFSIGLCTGEMAEGLLREVEIESIK
ncbi:1-phosphofructokinase [Bacillus sp. T33-2]|uniref:1-phosphofructokinase n=1 Tax=Bacillus sp. T33-2 TaxID=2054168 RepID=UPI000C764F5E|nr:1-phosphofructokinase [Bacillus sp. T33-2]PLR98820.1 1-phosphofructokinase [Bacillus sp. T33-2]